MESMTPDDFARSCAAVIKKANQAASIGIGINKHKDNKRRWKEYETTVHQIFVGLTPLAGWLEDYLEKNKTPDPSLLSQWEKTAIALTKAYGFVSGPTPFMEIVPSRLEVDTSLSSIVKTREARDINTMEVLSKVAASLVGTNDKLATSVAFESFNEGFWGNEWEFERDDVMWTVFGFVNKLRETGKDDQADSFYKLVLESLSINYESMGESYEPEIFFVYFIEDLFAGWNKKGSDFREHFIGFLGNCDITKEPLAMSTVITELDKVEDLESASRFCSIRHGKLVEELVKYAPSHHPLTADNSLQEKQTIGSKIVKVYELAESIRKDDTAAMRKSVADLKGEYLEDRVAEIAERMGYNISEKAKRQFNFKNPPLRECINGSQAQSARARTP